MIEVRSFSAMERVISALNSIGLAGLDIDYMKTRSGGAQNHVLWVQVKKTLFASCMTLGEENGQDRG